MAKICFIPKRFGADALAMIDKINTILDDYSEKGYTLTLRQLYYQLVGHDLFPDDRRFIFDRKKNKWIKSDRKDATKNALPNYKWLVEMVSDARDAGFVDWDAIEDRGRVPQLPSSWNTPADIAMSAYYSFRLNRWEGQENYVEVMCEKDALTGILLPVCRDLHVRFTANKGYSSSTAMKDAGDRIRHYLKGDASHAHFIYFGDHDPSGLDMSRDIQERLYQYCQMDYPHRKITIHRVALNYDQVQLWNPPPNPAKETDSRIAVYRDEYGDESWELDAVDPETLADLVREQIEGLIDYDTWNEVMARENSYKDELLAFARKFRSNGSNNHGTKEEDEDAE